MDMRSGRWNVRSHNNAGSLRTVAEQLSKLEYRRSNGTGVVLNRHVSMHYHWCEKHELGRGLSVHRGIVSEVNKVESVSDMSSYIMLRGC
jgi:hypothetical protein